MSEAKTAQSFLPVVIPVQNSVYRQIVMAYEEYETWRVRLFSPAGLKMLFPGLGVRHGRQA